MEHFSSYNTRAISVLSAYKRLNYGKLPPERKLKLLWQLQDGVAASNLPF